MKKLNLKLNKIKDKKSLIIFIVLAGFCLIAAILLFVFDKKGLCFLPIAIPIGYIVFSYLIKAKAKQKEIQNHEDEFVNMINYLEIFISNKFNIYNSFIEVKSYCSVWMRERIDELLEDIDNDKSVDPFIKFSRNFEKPIVENVMVAIFQMMEEGELSNQLNQFDILFQRFSENNHQAKLEKKSKQVDSLATLPLVSAGMVTIILTLGIMSIMGDILNVI